MDSSNSVAINIATNMQELGRAIEARFPKTVQRIIFEMAIQVWITNHQAHNDQLYCSHYYYTQKAIGNWLQPYTGLDGWKLGGTFSPLSGARIFACPTMDIMKVSRFARLVGFEYFKKVILATSVHSHGGVGHRQDLLRGLNEFIATLRWKLYGVTYDVDDDDSMDRDDYTSGVIVPYTGQKSGDYAGETSGAVVQSAGQIFDDDISDDVDDVSEVFGRVNLGDRFEDETFEMFLELSLIHI